MEVESSSTQNGETLNNSTDREVKTDTPNGAPRRQGRGEQGGGRMRESNSLWISLKHPKPFYDRAARELLASGFEEVEVFALGDAIVTAVDLATSLEQKEIVTVHKIETKKEEDLSSRTTGIHLILKKHKNFKGSRITPASITWCPLGDTPHTPTFVDMGLADIFASLVSGNASLGFDGDGQLASVGELLCSEASGTHTISSYASAHRTVLTDAWKAYEDLLASENPSAPMRLRELSGEDLQSSDIRATFCRPCTTISDMPSGSPIGATFIDVFAENKFPYLRLKNSALIYVVSPSAADFKTKDEFLNAVKETAKNMMTAVCDFNGMVRREEHTVGGLRRLVNVRIALFSGGSVRHSDVSKLDVARNIIAGFESEFHYGISPRLEFAYDEDSFKQAWMLVTGLTVSEESQNSSPIRYRNRNAPNDIGKQVDEVVPVVPEIST
eukprot:Lankesteria_metandrocarpae@DN9397_c0_g1_i1.p1